MKKSKIKIIYVVLILLNVLSIIYTIDNIVLKKEALKESELLNNYNKVEFIVNNI